MNDIGIIYYSSNKEIPEFEQKIVDDLLSKCGDLPIVSVTQKPMDLGKNIVVGDVGASGFNMFRQVLIACKESKTKFVLSAEADCVYPPDYFTFVPERDDICYRDENLYVMGQHRNYFFKKPWGATHAQIVGREFYIKRLEMLFEGCPEWSVEEKNFPKERCKKSDVFPDGSREWKHPRRENCIEFYETENPVVQIKTSHSMRHYTASVREPVYELPYWGKGSDFRSKYYNVVNYRH
jgi:hypothetical protein